MKKTIFLIIAFLLMMAQTAPAAAVSPAQDGQPEFLRARDGDPNFPRPAEVRFDANAVPVTFMPPVVDRLSPQAGTIAVDYVTNGAVNAFGTTCMTFPAQAQTAMQAAADAWEPLINSTVTIRIEACWASLGSGILGSSGALSYWRNFTNRPVANTYYQVALANALSGLDLDPASSCTAAGDPVSFCDDMGIMYNNYYVNDFYYGTDGNTGGKTDFMSVVMHEIGHALGMAGSMSVSGNRGYWGLGSGSTYYPIAYDRFTYDNAGTLLINYARNSTALGTALQTLTLTFRGAQAVKAYCGGNVPLYTPGTWQSGSSYSHFSDLMDSYDRGQNAMMTYSIGVNQVYHQPGAIMLGLLRDVGWNIPAALNVPTGLTAEQASATSILLNWADTNASPNETGYVIERSPNGVDTWTVIATTAANATSYTNEGLTTGNPYYYKVRAASGASIYCPSNIAGLTPTSALNAPANLAAAALPGRVNLSWDDLNFITDPEGHGTCGFWIDRSDVSETGPWTRIGTLGPFSRGFADSGVSEGTRYYYQVTVFTLDPAESAPSAIVQALTPLNAPTGLTAARAPAPAGGAILSWTDPSAMETGFAVERSRDGKTGWSTACTAPAGAQTCADAAAPLGIWYYRVQTVRNIDPANASAWSTNARLMLADYFFFAPLVVK